MYRVAWIISSTSHMRAHKILYIIYIYIKVENARVRNIVNYRWYHLFILHMKNKCKLNQAHSQ